MDTLSTVEMNQVSAGHVPPYAIAIGAGTGVYVGAATLIDATRTLTEFGTSIGEYTFNATNPAPLGQMVYTRDDFNLSPTLID